LADLIEGFKLFKNPKVVLFIFAPKEGKCNAKRPIGSIHADNI
jgi:hypothetical protein